MIVYFGKHFTSAVTGLRLVEVVCEKCGREYLYELARSGSGAADAPYGLGRARAERKAAERARQDLERRLENEAELVPCPRCQWINEDHVERFRRGRYRGWANTALGFGCILAAISLLIAWFLSNGPAADRAAALYFLMGGPIVSALLAGSIILARNLLRRRIQPNRDHPFPPGLPLGGPVPLVRNEVTGALEAAKPASEPAAFGDGDAAPKWIDLQIGRIVFPPVCCACLARSPQSVYQRPVDRGLSLAVPMCGHCAGRWTRQGWLGAIVGLALAGCVGVPLLLALKLDELAFGITAGLVGAFAPLIGHMVLSGRSAPFTMKVVDGPRGIIRLRFRNDQYREMIVKKAATRP